jgi:cell division septal protein FtsQ
MILSISHHHKINRKNVNNFKSFSIFIRKFGKISLTLLILFTITFILYTLFIQLFKLKEIQVFGENVNLQVNQQKLPENLIFLNTSVIEKQLANKYPQIDIIHLQKRYPHTLLITIRFKKAVAQILGGNQRFFVDANGIVLGIPKPGDRLPVINIPISDISQGEEITDINILKCLKFIKNLPMEIQVKEITMPDTQTIRADIDKTSIIIDQSTPIGPAVTTLQRLITGFRMKGTMPVYIDLRFDKPIIKY